MPLQHRRYIYIDICTFIYLRAVRLGLDLNTGAGVIALKRELASRCRYPKLSLVGHLVAVLVIFSAITVHEGS